MTADNAAEREVAYRSNSLTEQRKPEQRKITQAEKCASAQQK